MKPKTIIGILLLLGFGGLLMMNFGQQVGGYMNFNEATDSGANAHVVGKWVKEKAFTYDHQSNVFSFDMQDEKGTIRRVVYRDLKPANFEDAEQVVVEGKMLPDGQFEANHILVKCPSKYNDKMKPDATHPTQPNGTVHNAPKTNA